MIAEGLALLHLSSRSRTISFHDRRYLLTAEPAHIRRCDRRIGLTFEATLKAAPSSRPLAWGSFFVTTTADVSGDAMLRLAAYRVDSTFVPRPGQSLR